MDMDQLICGGCGMLVIYTSGITSGRCSCYHILHQVYAGLRKLSCDNVSVDVSASTRIVYGGSVGGSNCKILGGKTYVDGFLVGGASLKVWIYYFIHLIFGCCQVGCCKQHIEKINDKVLRKKW